MKLTRLLVAASLAAAALAFVAPASYAQPSGAVQAINPLSRDLPVLSTFTAAGAGTVNSSDQSGYNVSRITCVFRVASQSGTPSTVVTIQGKDSVSGQYYTLLAGAAVTTVSVNPYFVGAGVVSTANVSAGLPIPRFWRTSATTGGGTPSITGTIGCSVQ
jgi:hypothetical protein